MQRGSRTQLRRGNLQSRDVRLHFSLKLATAAETVEVTDEPLSVNPSSSTTSTLVSRSQIAEIAGADQTNSLAMITSVVPSATIVHDQLHVRGGHQVSWLLDGVPVDAQEVATGGARAVPVLGHCQAMDVAGEGGGHARTFPR